MTSTIELHVARLVPADASAVVALQDPSEGDEARVREELSRAWFRGWIARAAGGVAAGYVGAWHVADELHVLNVATRPTLRGRGVGTLLMRAALGYARTEGVRLVLLEVRRSNAAARRLYERLGFLEAHVRPSYYPDGEDALEMQLSLSA